MLCASAVDSMLKKHGYEKGWLNDRINEAVNNHLLTQEMGQWAHHVRLEANNPRHADKNEPLPTQEQAEQCIEFTEALADVLFVLPSRVRRGIVRAKDTAAKSEASASVTVRTLPETPPAT